MENCKTQRTASGGFLRRMWLFTACFLLAIVAQAQNLNVTGNVLDENQDPVIGATVTLKGTQNVTVTDIDGNFSLKNVPSNGTLVITYVGYAAQNIDVKGQTHFNVQLRPDAELLDEVVVVGYGSAKKSDVTGALTHVGADELTSRPVSNALEGLQGKAAGVDIGTSERPGTVASIRIRGERSLGASNSPLYVVDGVPLMSASGIETINPRDIESIDILKDASATAIYGSRGANGVVIVTTKQGKAGQFSLNYSGSVTWQNLVDRDKAASAADYIDYRRWAAYNADPEKYADPRKPTKASDEILFATLDERSYNNVMNGWATGSWNRNAVEDVDWTGMATRTGVVNEHTVSASGGTEKMNAFGSFGYLNNKGTQYGQEYNRYTFRLGANITPVKWMTIQMSINGSREKQDYGMSSSFAPSSTNSAAGIYELYKKNLRYSYPTTVDGERIFNPGGDKEQYDPINEWEHNISNRETWRFLGAFSAQLHFGEIWSPLKGLEYKISFGPDYRNWRQGDYIDTESAYIYYKGGSNTARWQTRRDFSWTLDNMITYNRTFDKKHNVGLTLLQSATKYDYETGSMSINRIEQDRWLWNAMGSKDITDKDNGASMSTGLNKRQLESYMIRVNYGFNDRYLLTASARWDGASQLSKGRKWAFFPSMSLGWRIQQENFLNDVDWLTNLKLRAGVGTTGNSAIDPYATLGAIQSLYIPTGNGSMDKGYTTNEPSAVKNTLVMANLSVGWEKTTQWNIGIDYGFLNNRINGSVEVYWSKTKDLLLDMNVPTVTGYEKTKANVGKTSNKGVEFTLNAIPVQTRDFDWTTSFNLAWQKDRIDELAYGKNDDVSNSWFIGEALSVYYGYTADGIWQNTPEDLAEMAKWNENGEKFQPGRVRPHDVNGDYKMDDEDRVIVGSKRPRVTAGWTNTFTWKGIDLSFMIYGKFNYWIQKKVALSGFGQLGSATDYWTPDNTGADCQMPYLTSVDTGDNDAYKDALSYKKGNLVRVRNISLGYNFPRSLVNRLTIQNLKIYGQVINPFDIHQSVDGIDLDTGNSYYNRSWVVGLEIGF